MAKEVILTGLRSNAEFHIGNYLGAILPMVELQRKFAKTHQINMFVPDLHSFTTPVNHSELYAQTLQNLKVYVAAGLDPYQKNTHIYRQSFITAHSELCVILNNFTYFGELSRMTQFKEKSDGEKEHNVTAGLFGYPVLMAADILLYGAQWVPVGDDQTQHLELARDLAMRLNNKFGKLFVVPNDAKRQFAFYNRDNGVRIRSLRNPEKKMSKSVADPAGTIMMTDTPSAAAKKVIGATTDSVGRVRFDFGKQPGISNLLQMLALLSGQTQKAVNAKWEGQQSYDRLKKAVAEAVSSFLKDFQTQLSAVDESKLMKKLGSSEAEMNEVAAQTLLRVQKAVGLRA
jgi:tryptophanyl-tRNA synthetase